MKILIGLTYYLPNKSGLSQYASILYEELIRKKHEVKVICSKSTNKAIIGVNGFRLGKGFIMPLYWIQSIKHVLWADVVNCHLPSLESFWLALWSKIFNKKLIVTYHCEFNTKNKLFDISINYIQSFALKFADKIIVNSYDYVEGYGVLKKHRNKIIEIYPPIKIDSTNNKLNLDGKYKIGFLGRISSEKNIEILIEATHKLPDGYCLYIAGPNNVKGEEKYQKFITEKIDNSPKIKILGKLDNPVEFYNSIDCLVLPSNNRLESFGMVSAEAIVSGCPVITSDIPGVRVPVLITKCGEVFDPTNVNDLVKKIQLVTKNRKEYINKTEIFNYKNTIDKYEEIFGTLLQQ